MDLIWPRLIEIQDLFIDQFNQTGIEIDELGMERFNHPGWLNRVWTSERYRRAHIDVVDARETRGLWMMHCCIFPHTNNTAPIFGFDVIAGRSKITGCFIDFSSVGFNDHPLIEWFGNEVSKLEWRKVRPLPEWAQRIFSPNIVSAGNVSSDEEIQQIQSLASNSISHYLDSIMKTSRKVSNVTDAQNHYCNNQKLNPHTPKVMASLGLNEDDVKVFIEECLFPSI